MLNCRPSRRASVVVVQKMRRADFFKMFRAMSMILFVAYPSISTKIFRLFQCTRVEGVYYLTVDMRLQCYTREWTGYALYGGVMLALYVIGLPLGTFAVLYRHRSKLFGPGSEKTLARFGFLYEVRAR